MTELTLQRLKACGWTPDRKVDISPIEEFYDEKGIVMPEFLREFFTQYAFLHIEYYDSKRDVHEEHHLSPSDYWEKEYCEHIWDYHGIRGTAYPVGQAFRENMDIYYHDDGNFYIFMGGGPLIRAGNTVNDLMNVLCGDWEHVVWEYIRQITHLALPSAEFELCINGKTLPYIAKENVQMGYYFDNDTFRKPNKMYEIWLNAADFKKGDIVTGKITGVPLNPDTTDECTINLLGVKDGMTYGLGTVDLNLEPSERQLFTTDIIDGGFKLTFNGNLNDYPSFPKDYKFKFTVAWIRGDGKEEYEIISFCTC